MGVAALPPALKLVGMGDLMGDVGQLAAMADHFDKIQKLKDPVAGCPNFRRVPGYKVYCCGQPTVAGFEAALNKVCGETYPKTGKIIWINMRQEPDVYIINDQVGLSRATTGCVVACLFKEFQITSSFDGLVETVPGMNLNLLKMDTYKMDMAKDTLFRGEFPVVMKLVEKLADGNAAKNECDKVIDKNGTPKTGGNGIKQLSENIAESKLSYEIMDDAAQAFLKVKIMDNIHKYYYMIAFTAYMREMAEAARGGDGEKLPGGKSAIPGNQLKLGKTFVTFMDAQPELRGLIDSGKGNLQWERDIPAAALANLESLANSDFKANLGKIIHDIYQTAHQ